MTTANVARFVHIWSNLAFRRMTSVDAQGNSHTDVKPRVAVYQLINRLGDGRSVRVSADEIVPTVSAWLAELGATSPLVEDLARAVGACDWPKVHALEDCLSVEVAVAACTECRCREFNRT